MQYKIWNKARKQWCKGCYADQSGKVAVTHPDDYTVVLSTGLFDRNNKLIYAGDIVNQDIIINFDVLFTTIIGEIKWCHDTWQINCKKEKQLINILSNCTIIGNIYEHPNLLNSDTIQST